MGKSDVKKEQLGSLKFSVVEAVTRDIPSMYEERVAGRKYVNWGVDNKYPDHLFNLYLNSAILQSIINGTVDFVCGNGISSDILNGPVNKDGELIEDIVAKLVLDYLVEGGYALNIIRNVEGGFAELYWLDIRNTRLDEDETTVFYCDKWNKYGHKPIEYPIFDPTKTQKSSVFYFKGHISRGIYPIPKWIGAMAAVETSTEIGKFHLNNILNNLTSSAIISFNNGIPTDEEKKQIEKKMKDKFSGADNAGKFMLIFNSDKEHDVTVARLSEDNMDQKFQTLAKSTREEIFISMRATPALFGLNPENNGFSKQEFLEAFELYNKTVVKPIQNDIKRTFEKIYGVNVLNIIPFSLDEVNVNKSEE